MTGSICSCYAEVENVYREMNEQQRFCIVFLFKQSKVCGEVAPDSPSHKLLMEKVQRNCSHTYFSSKIGALWELFGMEKKFSGVLFCVSGK